jgi:hypothetical protein
MAEEIVGSVGVPALVEAGFFDEDWTFLDPDLAGQDEIKQAINAATFACVGEVVPSATSSAS